MFHREATTGLARALLALVVGALVVAGCGKSGDRTSWDDDLVVQRERCRRLGLDFEEARAKADAACIVRSERLPEILVVGERRRGPDGAFAPGPPCDFDAVIMGPKTFIAGVEKATDRAMLFSGWRQADEARKRALFLAWFDEALTAGSVVVEAGAEGPLVAVGKTWKAPQVEHADKRYVATGWVKSVAADGSDRFELKRCALTETLSFEGCTVVDAFGGD